jgi:hypothetical protein
VCDIRTNGRERLARKIDRMVERAKQAALLTKKTEEK